MWPSRSSAQTGVTRLPVAMASMLSAATAPSIGVSAPSGLMSAQAKGWSSGCFSWAWVTVPHEKHPLDQPFAWALIKLDGADTPMLGAVAAGSIDAIATGSRVTPVWADEREGHINDLTHWVLEDGGAA